MTITQHIHSITHYQPYAHHQTSYNTINTTQIHITHNTQTLLNDTACLKHTASLNNILQNTATMASVQHIKHTHHTTHINRAYAMAYTTTYSTDAHYTTYNKCNTILHIYNFPRTWQLINTTTHQTHTHILSTDSPVINIYTLANI